MHFNGVDRLSTDALMLNAAMFIEVIAQRAGLKALSPDDPNFAQAQAALSALRQFAQSAPPSLPVSAVHYGVAPPEGKAQPDLRSRWRRCAAAWGASHSGTGLFGAALWGE